MFRIHWADFVQLVLGILHFSDVALLGFAILIEGLMLFPCHHVK